MPRKPPENRGLIAPSIEVFVSNFLLEVGPKDLNIDEAMAALTTCPPLEAAFTTIVLMGVGKFGDYTHPKPKIQGYIRSNFERMDGSFKTAIAQCFLSAWLGYTCHEISHRQEGKDWMLQSLTFINPARWVFKGRTGGIESIHYFGNVGDLYIPYDKVLHVIHQQYLALDNSPYGVRKKSAIAPYRAWKILVAQLTIAAGRQANGLLVGYVDPAGATQPLLDEKGGQVLGTDNEPLMVDPAEDMGRELAAIDGKTYIVTSSTNRIENLKIEPDINFYLGVLKYLHKLMYLSLLFPETMLELVGGGSGDSNLHEGQYALLSEWVEQLADQIKEAFLERVVRQLIVWKFGEQDDWGSFPVPEGEEKQRIELFNAISSALTNQIFTADDLDAINRLRQLAKLPELKEIVQPTPPEVPEDLPTDEAPEPATFSIPMGVDYWKMFDRNGNEQKKGAIAP
jgi:hypothetical protein